jgi:phage terminase large subunit GpA-like protein
MISELIERNISEILQKAFNFNTIKLEPSEWVEQTVYLTSAESHYSGFFSYDVSPYSREIIDNLSPSSDVEMMGIMKCAQSGFTAGVVVNIIAYIISQNQCQVIFVSGSDQLVRDTIRDRLDPVIQHSGNIADLIGPSSIKKANHRTGDTDIKKEFAGGALTCLTYKPSKLRQYSAKVVLADEFDDAPRNNILEGSIRMLLETRTTSFGNAKKLCYISTPTTKGISNIEEVYNMGDKRQWNWECPHCETYIPILWKVEKEDGTFGGIKWSLDDEFKLIESSVHYECQNCSGKIEYRKKTSLNLTGKWIPTATPLRPQYRSYSFNALCIPSGFDDWIKLVTEFLLACPPNNGTVDIGLLKVFTNTRLGELWEERGKSPRSTDLMSNQRSYQIGVIPNKTIETDGNGKVALISLACDLGGIMDYENNNYDVRLDWEIVVHTSNGQMYSIDHGSIGTFKRTQNKTKQDILDDNDRKKWTYIHNVENSVWDKLKDIIYTPLVGEDGLYFDIDITVIDTGFCEKLANIFIEGIKDRRVLGVKGQGEENYRKMDKNGAMITHSKLNKGLLYHIDVNLVKDIVSSNMSLKLGTDGSQRDGFMNFPQPSNGKYGLTNYFSHYEAEHRVPEIKNGIEVGSIWKKKREDNHFFDVAVYNYASREIFIADTKLYDKKYKDITWGDYCSLINE